MRIAVWHNLPSGGGKRALYDHVRGLLRRGHHVESWCPPTADQTFLPLSRLLTEHVRPLSEPIPNVGDGVIGFATYGAFQASRRFRAMDDHVAACAAEIERGSFDVVLGNSCWHLGAAPLARHLDQPSVLYLQEPYRMVYEASDSWPMSAPHPRAAVKQRWLRESVHRVRSAAFAEVSRVLVREEHDSAAAYDQILVNSFYSRESVVRAYGLDPQVCYLGVDTDRYVDRRLEREHMVIGIGQFSPHKRIDVAIRAVAELGAAAPCLVWIGNAATGRYLQDLEDLAARLDVDFRPRLGVAHDEVVDALNRAACLIYAPRLEPFGFAPIEAAACGLPVVAVREGGVRETVIDGVTGMLVDDVAEIGAALGRVMTEPALRRRMGEAARLDAMTRWSLDDATTRLETHLLSAAREARAMGSL